MTHADADADANADAVTRRGTASPSILRRATVQVQVAALRLGNVCR